MSTAYGWDELVDRVGRLESRLAWYRRVAAAAVVAAVAVGLVAANADGEKDDEPAGEKVVEADKFVLRGKDGKPVALLQNGPAGPQLVFLDAKEGIRAYVGYNVKSDVPQIFLQNEKATKALVMGVADDEEAIVFKDRGISRLVVDTNDNGDPLVVLKDREGKARTILSGYAGDPGIHVTGSDQKTKAQLFIGKEGPKLLLTGEDGTPILEQPSIDAEP